MTQELLCLASTIFIPVVMLTPTSEREIGTRFRRSVELWQIRSHALQALHLAALVRESETKARLKACSPKIYFISYQMFKQIYKILNINLKNN